MIFFYFILVLHNVVQDASQKHKFQTEVCGHKDT